MAAPPVPTGLAAVAGNHNVALTWNDSAGAVSYDVYRDDLLLTTVPASTFKALAASSAGSSGDSAALTVATSGTTYPAMSTLFDNFDSASLAKWGPSGGATISGGVLYVPCTTSYDGLISVGTFDLTGSALAVQVPQASVDIPAAGAYTGVQLFDPLTSFSLTLQANSQSGNLELLVAGSATTTIVYDPAVHCWWRIRHSTTSGNITLETSADGSSYTTRRTVAPPAPIVGLKAYLYTGYGTGTTAPAPAQFDNVNSMATSIQAPANFTATSVGFRQITLAWAASTGAVSYELLRDGALYRTQTTTGYTDQYALGAAGETHTYAVRAVRATARSNPSATQSATVTDTAPTTPTNLIAIPQAAGTVNLTWDPQSPAPDQYRIGVKRNTDATYSAANDAIVAGARTNFLVDGLPSGVLMNFRVRAERTAASAYTTTVNATPN